VSLFPHLVSCTPNKFNFYLVDFLATAVSERDTYRLLTFHLRNKMSLFHCLVRTKGSVQARGTCMRFVIRPVFCVRFLLTPRPTPKVEDYTLSAVRDFLFNTFAATLHIGGRSSLRNLRTRHAMVTGTHLSWLQLIEYDTTISQEFTQFSACL
jgi:hypothetical protein